MRVNFAHLRVQGIDFAVFEADARSRTSADRLELLSDLASRARRLGLHVDKAALACARSGRIEFYGTPDLVRYLSKRGVPQWTHVLDISAT